MVLLHGWGMNSAVWNGLLPYLQERCCVYCIDLPGHGSSENVVPGLGDDELLQAWLDALDAVLPEQFHLCGWSLGGLLALAIRQRWPRRVKGVVLLASSPRFLAAEGWPALPVEQLDAFSQGVTQNIEATLRQFLALQFLGLPDSRLLQRSLWRALQGQGVANQQGLGQGLQLLQQLDLRDDYARGPSVVVLGGRDRLVPPVLLESMRALNPSSRVELWPQAAHAPHWLEPLRVAELISNFINDESEKP